MELDIAIVGGGPAGAATALSLLDREPLRVGIFERSPQPVFRIGESVPPSIQFLLARLGVFDAFERAGHWPSLGNCSAWGDDELGFNDFWASIGGRGWHLNRAQFDASLLQAAAERGAVVQRGVRVMGGELEANGQWRLALRDRNDNVSQVTAAFVVDASGPRSVFARGQGVRTVRMDNLLGLAAVFPLTGTEAKKTAYTLIEAAELGWWYAARLPGQRLIVTLMCDRDLVHQYRLSQLEQWTATLRKTRHVQFLTDGTRIPSKLLIQPAFSQYLERASGDRWLAVGDAACKLDPLSSAGIYKALRSGIQAAETIQQFRQGQHNALRSYAAKNQYQFERYLEDRRQYYAQETRWSSSPFWQRRQGKLTLAPETVLSHPISPQTVARLKRLDAHLPPKDLQLLYQLCDKPKPASEVVANFLAQTASQFSAYRPIEALQYLIEQNVLQVTA